MTKARIKIKPMVEKVLSSLSVKVLDISNQNVLLSSRNKKKGLFITWYDCEREKEISDIMKAYSGKYETESESNNKDISNEETTRILKIEITKSKEICI